jgi:hypothetical protein
MPVANINVLRNENNSIKIKSNITLKHYSEQGRGGSPIIQWIIYAFTHFSIYALDNSRDY